MFWQTEEYGRLVGRLHSHTAFDALGLSHDERAFTKMISVMLSKRYVGDLVALKFLRGLVSTMDSKHGEEYPVVSEFAKKINAEDAHVVIVAVVAEQQISVSKNGVDYKGYIDLLVDVNVEIGGDLVKYRIVLENKVGSKEHKLGQHENGPWQTDGYKTWASQFGDVRTCYAFLAPSDEVLCHCNAYARLNYQEVADLIDTLCQEIPEDRKNIRALVEDFVSVLGPTLEESDRSMAVITNEMKEMIAQFWDHNKEELVCLLDIIRQAQIDNIAAPEKNALQGVCNGIATNLIFRIGQEDVSEDEFRQRFIEKGTADRVLTYSDGHEDHKPWKYHSLGETANLRGNVQSQNWWRNRSTTGLTSVVCQVD